MSLTAILLIFGFICFAVIGLIAWTLLYPGAINHHVWRLP